MAFLEMHSESFSAMKFRQSMSSDTPLSYPYAHNGPVVGFTAPSFGLLCPHPLSPPVTKLSLAA